ncbi:MAG: PRC-barrel domain-containing protein [Alphaproteobacteria bacterium]
MTSKLKLTTAATILVMALTGPAFAQTMDSQTPQGTMPKSNTAVDANTLIGKSVVNAEGDTVGEIETVIVSDSGAIENVIIDVGDWLASSKLISVAREDLTISPDGKTVTALNLTRESGTSAPAYTYTDESWRGHVVTRSGKPYTSSSTYSPSSGSSAGSIFGRAVMNPNGTLNTSQLIGLDIQGTQNEKIGDVSEIIMTKDGQVDGVVVDVGGFLGVGARPVRIGWQDLTLSGQGDNVTAKVNYTKDRLEQMPEYKASAER